MEYLTEKELTAIAIEIVKQLNGMTISQAIACLSQAQELLLDSHKTDINSPLFQEKLAEWYAFLGEPDL